MSATANKDTEKVAPVRGNRARDRTNVSVASSHQAAKNPDGL